VAAAAVVELISQERRSIAAQTEDRAVGLAMSAAIREQFQALAFPVKVTMVDHPMAPEEGLALRVPV
jgi:hypothetical protein